MPCRRMSILPDAWLAHRILGSNSDEDHHIVNALQPVQGRGIPAVSKPAPSEASADQHNIFLGRAQLLQGTVHHGPVNHSQHISWRAPTTPQYGGTVPPIVQKAGAPPHSPLSPLNGVVNNSLLSAEHHTAEAAFTAAPLHPGGGALSGGIP